MSKVYFISDLHFFHSNILKFTERNKAMGLGTENTSVGLMNEWIIKMWNNTVKAEDTVYILGDLSFINQTETAKLIDRLNGHKHIIYGNHDKSARQMPNHFESASDIKLVVFKEKNYNFLKENFVVVLSHYPLLAWDRRMHGSCMVHGHTHGNLDEYNDASRELRVDVGLDGALANYGMVSLEQLYQHFKKVSSGMNFSDYVKAKSEDENIKY